MRKKVINPAHKIDYQQLLKYSPRFYRRVSMDEKFFYQAYMDTLFHEDLNDFALTVGSYWDAVVHIRYLNYEMFNITDELIEHNCYALQKYRLKYVVDRLGWDQLDKFFAEFIKTKHTSLFPELEELLNPKKSDKTDKTPRIKLSELFINDKPIAAGSVSIDPNSDKCLTSLFTTPALVKFTSAAHDKFIKQITEMSGDELARCVVPIEYYLMSYIFNENTLAYVDVLPAVTHIIEVLPPAGEGEQNTARLFWFASDVIDRAWRYLAEDEPSQLKFRDFVFDLFSPRVGGLWPIVHYDEFEFKNPVQQEIFVESLGFMLALKDLTIRAPEFSEYFARLGEGYEFPLEEISRRALQDILSAQKPDERFEAILDIVKPEYYDKFFRYPENVKEAKPLVAELLRTDDDARITGLSRIKVYESLLLTPNALGVGVFILSETLSNFNIFAENITKDALDAGLDPLDTLLYLFTAAATGVTEENEFPPLKGFGKKVGEYAFDYFVNHADKTLKARRGGRKAAVAPREVEILTTKYTPKEIEVIIDSALKSARNHRRTVLFQRSALQQVF